MDFDKDFRQVVTIIEQLRATNSTNDKIVILKENSNNELLKMVLFYTYNPYMKYGITEDVYNKTTVSNDYPHGYVFSMFDELEKTNINDKRRTDAVSYIENHVPNYAREVVKCILFKDLRIGIAEKGINKVWKNLIPTFDVMLAESFAKQKDGFLDGKSFSITEKLDGSRIVYEPLKQEFYSRQGQVYEGLDHLLSECKELSQGKYILDGELIYRNYDNLKSDELYRLTMSVSRKKGITEEKKHLEFHVFDIVPVDEFKQGRSKLNYQARRELLNSCFVMSKGLDFVKNVPVLYSGIDQSIIKKLMDDMVLRGKEGLMINLNANTYECKRSKHILKVKQFHEADVRVIEVHEGTGRNKGKLGAVTIEFEHNGNIHTCDIGSGFSDYDRELFYNDTSLILNKIITINYFEVSENKNGGFSLRFPTYAGRIRDDKDTISMH